MSKLNFRQCKQLICGHSTLYMMRLCFKLMSELFHALPIMLDNEVKTVHPTALGQVMTMNQQISTH